MLSRAYLLIGVLLFVLVILSLHPNTDFSQVSETAQAFKARIEVNQDTLLEWRDRLRAIGSSGEKEQEVSRNRAPVSIDLPSTAVEAPAQELFLPTDTEDDDEAPPVLTVPCHSDERNSAAFWTVKRNQAADSALYQVFDVAPAQQILGSFCSTTAIFSSRIVLQNATYAAATYLLDPPQPVSQQPDTYRILVPKVLSLPTPGESESYRLQVTLEFGHYQSGLAGLPCGPKSTTCNLETIAKTSSPKFSGQVLEPLLPVSISPISAQKVLPPCTSFNSLPGYWHQNRYYPTKCSLHHGGSPLPISPPDQKQKNWTWLHMVGDSNTRQLYFNMLDMFCFHSKHQTMAKEGKDANSPDRPVVSVVFASTTATRETHPTGRITLEEADLVITATWFLIGDIEKYWKEEAQNLLRLTDTDLLPFLENNKQELPASIHQFINNPDNGLVNLQQTRTLVSFGSHSVGLTALGSQKMQDVMVEAMDKGGLLKADDKRNLRVMTTSAADPAHIPQVKFPKQDLMRNNVIISARNNLIRQDRRLSGRVIDVEQLTASVVYQTTKSVNDAVHFQHHVYYAWADVIFSELLTRSRDPATLAIESETLEDMLNEDTGFEDLT